MVKFLRKLANFVRRLITSIVNYITFTGAGSYEEKRNEQLIDGLVSLFTFPLKNLSTRKRATNLEEIYDDRAGHDIKLLEGEINKKDYYIIDGKINNASESKFHETALLERSQLLSRFSFESILEVGVGELETLSWMAEQFGTGKDYYGLDISFNRIYQGLQYFEKKFNYRPKVCKANAMKLPYPDNSFDVSYTNHCLELMPNGYRTAIKELKRVTRNNLLLFEPSYEQGGVIQRLQMRSKNYVRGIPKFVESLDNINYTNHGLLNTGQIYNRTAFHELEVLNSSKKIEFHYRCPKCQGNLMTQNKSFSCENCQRVYFEYYGIPILDSDLSVLAT